MTINKEAINKTIDYMRKETKVRLNMGTWIGRNRSDPSDNHWCGTTACIAGYVILAERGFDGAFDVGSYSAFGRKTLGLTDIQRQQLFYPAVHEAWLINKEQAIRLLEHLRDYGKVDWSVIGFYNIKDEFYDEF